jgi:protoporphyrinogen oxidase
VSRLEAERTCILGAGVTGLAAGMASGFPVFEARNGPGGIAASYYLRRGSSRPLSSAPADGEAYRFEIGGGHWIFGGDAAILAGLELLAPMKSYTRLSSVYFSRTGLKVPYPLQNHLRYLGLPLAKNCLQDARLAQRKAAPSRTMGEWLESNFGKTLCELFFDPFHCRYTAGLYREIAPQDGYKSPPGVAEMIRGASGAIPSAGYNARFRYPREGLDALVGDMARRCRVVYRKKAVVLQPSRRRIIFEDGSVQHYDRILSTLPLNQLQQMCRFKTKHPPDPYTSALVLNVWACKGKRYPEDHWLYIPDARSGFHRVGFYSNVDAHFLPRRNRPRRDRAALYVERAYSKGTQPTRRAVRRYIRDALLELRAWGFIQDVEVAHPTWISVAYTWSRPGSSWKTEACQLLQRHGIFSIGRYGRWVFQGIADSIQEGFGAGAAFRAGVPPMRG